MVAIRDLTAADFIGATTQWRDYVADTLGYDHSVTSYVAVKADRIDIWVMGADKFQEHLRYGEEIGRLSCLQEFPVDHDWDAACRLVWERVKAAMPRDERELRYGLKAMSGAIEHAPSFTSAVGKMLAERICAVRDEVSKHLIEYRRTPQPAE